MCTTRMLICAGISGAAALVTSLGGSVYSIVKHMENKEPAAALSGLINEVNAFLQDPDFEPDLIAGMNFLGDISKDSPNTHLAIALQVALLLMAVPTALMTFGGNELSASTKLSMALNIVGRALQATGLGLSITGCVKVKNDPVSATYYTVGGTAAMLGGSLLLFGRRMLGTTAIADAKAPDSKVPLVKPTSAGYQRV